MSFRIQIYLAFFLLVGLGKFSRAQSSLLVGTSKINITTKSGEPLHDSLFARVLILKTSAVQIAFVAADQGIFTSPEIEQFCKDQLGISQVFISSSHTHSGGKTDKNFVNQQIIKAIKTASGNMFQSKITAGHRSFPQLGFNRLIVREDGHSRESWFSDDHFTSENPERIPFGPVDPEVGVIKIEDLKGETRAILMNYAMHSDIVCSNYEISADYPGVACRKVEESLGNKAICLFIQGAGGNVESLIISSRRTGPNDPFKSDYNTIERVGGLLAYEAVKLSQSLPPAKNETDIRLLNDSPRFTGRFTKSAKFDIRTSTILINNNIVIATCPGEPFVQLQLEWKKKIRDADGCPFLFGYTWYDGTWPNYIADIKSAAQGGYGADQDSPTLIQIGAGEAIMNRHFENYFRLNGLMRTESGPTGFKRGSQWRITEVQPQD